MANLPGAYAAPSGELFLAVDPDGTPVAAWACAPSTAASAAK